MPQHRRFARPRRSAAVASILVALALAGCARGTLAPETRAAKGPDGSSLLAPVAASPAGAVQLLQQAFLHLDPTTLPGLFTGDYRFAFAAADSAGNAFAGRTLSRVLELESDTHLLATGTTTEPPASSLVLVFGSLAARPDPRPGKSSPWHQEIATDFTLSVATARQTFRVAGSVAFFLVRGDSAQIPADAIARGVRPDANRWWIERWEDDSPIGFVGASRPAPASTLPATTTSWGALKVLYLGP